VATGRSLLLFLCFVRIIHHRQRVSFSSFVVAHVPLCDMSLLATMATEFDDIDEDVTPSGDVYSYTYFPTKDDDVSKNMSIESAESLEDVLQFEAIVRIVVSVIFGMIALLGLVGNLSVIIVVMANNSMRSTTNILIIGLALADLVFIVVCVPFTALSYVLTVWPFGQLMCKVSEVHLSHN
jgi:7 transmembrane receptor (rhodopsin family)